MTGIPQSNEWYTNATGQLFKVRLVGYRGADMFSMVIEYIDGRTQTMTNQDWSVLQLIRHKMAQSK